MTERFVLLHTSLIYNYMINCKRVAHQPAHDLNALSANPTKWSNTLKQFVGNLPTNCLSLFDHFVKLALKGLITLITISSLIIFILILFFFQIKKVGWKTSWVINSLNVSDEINKICIWNLTVSSSWVRNANIYFRDFETLKLLYKFLPLALIMDVLLRS